MQLGRSLGNKKKEVTTFQTALTIGSGGTPWSFAHRMARGWCMEYGAGERNVPLHPPTSVLFLGERRTVQPNDGTGAAPTATQRPDGPPTPSTTPGSQKSSVSRPARCCHPNPDRRHANRRPSFSCSGSGSCVGLRLCACFPRDCRGVRWCGAPFVWARPSAESGHWSAVPRFVGTRALYTTQLHTQTHGPLCRNRAASH